MIKLTDSQAWLALAAHQAEMADVKLNDLFAADQQRATKHTVTAAGLQLDYSKNHISDQTIKLLSKLAEHCKLKAATEKLFTGAKVNITENCAAWHTALRDPKPPIEVQTVLTQLTAISEKIRNSKWLGFSGNPITDVVNIGIGGSDLGPRLAVAALQSFKSNEINCHFVANIDGSEISQIFNTLNPQTTLFVISSKSFTTQETLTNAETAKQWLLQNSCAEQDLQKHFIAVTANADKAKAFGVDAQNILPIWEWVGGRFSLWSAVGLPIAVAIGMKQFKQLLAGAYAMDQHFRNAEFIQNMPMLLALLSIWQINFWHWHQHAIIPYAENLSLLPTYLQQLEMESNGKHVQVDGTAVNYHTAPIIFGGTGTCSQHTFHQLLYQGTVTAPIDFIVPLQANHDLAKHHKILVANAFAQSEALMRGNINSEAVTYKIVPGNKPSNMITLPKIDPYHLGALIALYEHKVFVQGCIWNINSFDQWGVELGKLMAKSVLA